jgi:lipopolysaccharide export system ATP-binding protein
VVSDLLNDNLSPSNPQFPNEAERLLEVFGLVKVYQLKRVVDGVDFYVSPGEIVGLLGPNGAGKTTSFRITVGLIAPTEGKVVFNGDDVTRLPMYKRARLGMGYLSQEPSVFQRLTVRDNILAILETLKISHAERESRLEQLLGELELTRLADSFAYTLSGGERRRLEITRALVTSPKLLLLDEPFSGVDPIAVADIQKIIISLRDRGMGILLTDHNVRETLSITNRAYLIKDGSIMVHGSPDEILNDVNSRKYYLGEDFRM